jgi:pSer/pThr/pTyr-binding forkhead associated (FHA) protein
MRLALHWTEAGEDIILPLPASGTVRIGRDEACDVVLADTTVSRLHAVIVIRDGMPVLRHISRTNPTYVNGKIMIGEVPLHLGDELWFPVRMIDVTAINWPSPDSGRTRPDPRS